jgi:hypothetical protein
VAKGQDQTCFDKSSGQRPILNKASYQCVAKGQYQIGSNTNMWPKAEIKQASIPLLVCSLTIKHPIQIGEGKEIHIGVMIHKTSRDSINIID